MDNSFDKINSLTLSMVTVNWNRKDDIDRLIDSLYSQEDKNFEIIIVDNNSKDGSKELIDYNYKNIKLISLNNNYGVISFNKGVDISNSDFCVLLDNDVTLPKNFTKKLKNIISQFPAINVFALNILDSNGVRQKDYLPQNASKPVYWHNFIGGGVVFKTDYYKKLGGYDDDFFIYINETDLAARILIDNQKILYCPDITLTHKTSSKARVAKTAYFYYTRNALLFFSRYFPLIERYNLILGFILINFKKSLRNRLLHTLITGLASYITTPKKYNNRLKKIDRDNIKNCFQGNPSLSTIIKNLWNK